MAQPSMSQLRAELHQLTADLRALGVTGLAYPADLITRMSRGTLVSCILWAKRTVTHINSK